MGQDLGTTIQPFSRLRSISSSSNNDKYPSHIHHRNNRSCNDGQRNVEDTDNNSAHVRDSLASTAYPLANPKPGFSLLGDRGVVAGTCADIGWNYVFSYAEDIRSQKWDLQALKSHRTQGVATKLCGYGYDKYFDGARGYTMLDIGANMGLSLMPYYSKGWKVVAFEPIKDNINTLRRNLFINGITEDQVALVEGAVTNQSGILEIYAPRGRTDNTALSRKGSTLNVGGDVDVEKVTAIEIDTYINNAVSSDLRRNIMLVKIDTQGHELNVLQGMKSFLSAPPSNEDLGGWSFVVVAEYHVGLQKAAGHDPNEVLNFMRSLGYEVRCKLTDIDPILSPASPKCGDVIFSKGKPTKPESSLEQ
eukprot:scaffold37352_cov153-Skeletonema_marinoi.AAC.1